ncbi:MAG: response regulator [candidate division WOR-3 bacterium]
MRLSNMAGASPPPNKPPRLIAIVDDEPDILELVAINLNRNGFRTETFTNARDFYHFLENQLPDLVILDLMLPDVDGLDICRLLKSEPRTRAIPIIMLTARGEETDRVIGLELGADDYVTKPFSARELVARVKSVLRRQEMSLADEKITLGGIVKIDPQRHEVEVDGKRIDLTTTEFRLLLILAKRPGWVFTRNQILDELWGEEKAVLDRTVDVHIKHLRAKLGKAGNLIRNIRGVGYKIEA